MTNLTAIVNGLGVRLAEVIFWDESVGVIPAADLVAGLNLLGQHVTQPGYTGVLCYWMQHYFRDVDPPACECRGSLYPLPDVAENDPFWRVTMARSPLPGLARFREIRNPWYSDAGCCAPCFYPTAVSAAKVPITIEYHSPNALQVDYVVAGRIIGFDFPQKYLDRQRSPGERAEA